MIKFLKESAYRKSVLRTTIPVAVFLGFALCFGAYLERDGKVDFAAWQVWFFSVLAAVLSEFGLIALWLGLDAYSRRTSRHRSLFFCKRWHWAAAYLLLVICYSVTFLAVFPGFFAYDATMAHWQIRSGMLTSQHPWIHTVLLGYICEFSISHFGHANVGIAIYIYAQMLFVAGCFTYTLYSIKRRGGHDLAVFISLLFYAFFPTIHMFALCSTKDTIFTAVMLVLLLLLWDMFEDREKFFASKGRIAVFLFFSLLFMILRKNAIYAMLVFIPFFLLLLKGKRLQGGLVMGAVLGLFWLYDGPLTKAVGIYDIGPQEALSVPSQQLARVYNENRELLTPEEQTLLERFYQNGSLETYLPKLADCTKGILDGGYFMTHLEDYVRLWGSVGLRAPDIYVNSFLVNSYGFWYPMATLDGYRGFAGMKDTVLENAETYYFAYVTETPGERVSLIPWLDNLYFRLSTEKLYHKLPGISLLFSPGFLFWVFAAAGAYSVHRRKKQYGPVFLLAGLVWLTVLLGPIALVRYVLFLFFGLPIALSVMLEKEVPLEEI